MALSKANGKFTAKLQLISGTSKDDNGTVAYTVLYYKRKNKVHKSKGVSKMDGVLKISSQSLVSLTDSNGALVVAPRREPEIGRQVLEDDSIVNLGSYEAEIISILSDGASFAIPPEKKNLAGDTFLRPLSQKRAARLPRKPRLSKANGPTNDSMKDNSIHKTLASHPNLKRSAPLGVIQQQGKRPTVQVDSRPQNISRGRVLPITTPREAAAGSSLFPGAAGKIDLPHSIASVLKLHQRTGITFLWNCLTGHAEVSPHSYSASGLDGEDNDDGEQTPQAAFIKQYKGGCVLADEMGLGKTLMTIAIICALYRQRRDKKYIVVCPSSLVSNWSNEFEKWLGNACQPKRVVVTKGGKEAVQQIKVFCQPSKNRQAPQVLIISYDIFRLNVSHFQAMPPGLSRLLVVDEGHRLKNSAGSLTLTALESLSCESRLLLTATPIQNVLSDFFAIANFCCPGILGDLNTFRRDFDRPITASNQKNCSSQLHQRGAIQARVLDEITQTFMLRRLQKDVLKTILPPRQEIMLFCRPSAQQCSMYHQLASSQRRGVDGSGATADALTTITNLRKLCLHPCMVYCKDTPGICDISLSGKLMVVRQLLTNIREIAPHDKVVIVSNFTSVLNVIERSILQHHSLSYVRLDGTTELSRRQSIVDTFNKTSSERIFAFLLSSKAGGCGLNLIGANRLLMLDADFNPASDIQAMARIYRQGQQKPCTIYRLFTSGTVEEVICQRQIQKGNLATRAVDSKKNGPSLSFTKEELQDCFTLKENCPSTTKERVGKAWSDYDGPSSIIAQGCNDEPLIQVSDKISELVFVHVVDAEEGFVVPETTLINSNDVSTKEEWCDSTYTTKADSLIPSSDEENEFE